MRIYQKAFFCRYNFFSIFGAISWDAYVTKKIQSCGNRKDDKKDVTSRLCQRALAWDSYLITEMLRCLDLHERPRASASVRERLIRAYKKRR